jgi:replicative DNA helicase
MKTETSTELEWQYLRTLAEQPAAHILEASTQVDAQDFASETTRRIFTAIQSLATEGATIDHLSVQIWAEQHEPRIELDDIIRLLDLGSVAAELPRYAKLLRIESKRRRLRSLLDVSTRRLDDPSESFDTTMAELGLGLMQIQVDTHHANLENMADLLPDFLNRLAAIRAGGDGVIGLTTGIATLDDMSTGIRPGELWVVGALPGRGKTAFALQCACANAKLGRTVIVMAMEMSKDQNAARTVAHVTQTNATVIRDPRILCDDQFMKLVELTAEHKDDLAHIWIDDAANLTVRELAQRVRLYIRQKKADLVVVDYLQLVQGANRDVRERVAAAANALRVVAKQEGVAILLLSQLRRPQNSDINEVPNATMLKESGDIESHAHTVLLLYQPIDKQTQRPTGEDVIIVGKQRNGPLGEVPVIFDGPKLTFRPREGYR